MKQPTLFQERALDFHNNIALTANAGSGKTFVLSKRFIEILLETDAEIENIVAITFTDKAAGDLNKKIADELSEKIKNETDSNKLTKLENVRRSLVSANISTIHSFCANILKEFAPEANIDTNFIPIDQTTSDELIVLSIEESINKLISDIEYENSMKYLIRMFGSKNSIVKEMKKAIEQRKVIGSNIIPLYEKSEEDFFLQMQKSFLEKFNCLFVERTDEVLTDITNICEVVLKNNSTNQIALDLQNHIINYGKADSFDTRLKILIEIDSHIFTEQNEVRKRGFFSKGREDYQREVNKIEKLFNDLRPILYSNYHQKSYKEYYKFGKNFIRIFKHASELYHTKKSSKGYLDFEDLLLYTQRIIQLPEVQHYLSEKYKYIMIDEYQDTNETQYQIFMPILDHLKKGNLFVVGDEKQSIYMFRNAELEVFYKTKDEIQNLDNGGKILELPHNFRMVPQLILFTNKLFSELLQKSDTLLNEVEYNELIGASDKIEKGVVEFLIADKMSSMSEAEMVANKILKLVSSNELNLNDIAILCRKRNMFSEIEKAFVKKSIPFTVLGGKGFFQKQSIRDVHSYLSFLINQEDDSSLIATLRSPFYQLSDRLLFLISKEEGKTFFEKLCKYSQCDSICGKALRLINSHQAIAKGEEIHSLIRKILIDTGYWIMLSAKKSSAQEIANMEKLIAIAREYSRKSFKNLFDFIFYLREAIEISDEESQAQIARDENTVKLITIHQAKGLEFRAVFIYGTNEYSYEEGVRAKAINIDKEFGIISKINIENDFFSPSSTLNVVALYSYIQRSKNIAEIKRLFYVAVTRAASHLYLSATIKKDTPSKNSFYELLNFVFGEINKNILLHDNVKFIDTRENKIFNRIVELEIPVQQEIDDQPMLTKYENISSPNKRYLTNKIVDHPKKEIISATKLSMFHQCPVKYELTYELGFSSIHKIIKESSEQYNFNSKEDEELKPFADIYGKIIHSVLSEQCNLEEIDKVVDKYLSIELSDSPDIQAKLKMKANAQLIMFYNSMPFNDLEKYKNFKNEFEVYSEEGEHYLYGIIDKLIIDKDRLIIVDYKTDQIPETKLNHRANDYFPQLKFYAYILSKIFPDYGTFELRLIFLNHLNNVKCMTVEKDSMLDYEKELAVAINKIIKKNYKPNIAHCEHCNFALESNKCVKQF